MPDGDGTAAPAAHGAGDGHTDEALRTKRDQRSNYTRALIAELRLLVRTISNDPARRLSDLELTYQPKGGAPTKYESAEILNRIACISRKSETQENVDEIAFLQLARDALVRLTGPATGLTVAYTTLVTGGQRSQDTESSFDLANEAYGRLGTRAKVHGAVVWALVAVTIVLTCIAASEATKAALGRALLHNLDLLRTEQIAITADKLKLETSLDQRPSEGLAGTLVKQPTEGAIREHDQSDALIAVIAMVPLCDRYRVRQTEFARLLEGPETSSSMSPSTADGSVWHASNGNLARRNAPAAKPDQLRDLVDSGLRLSASPAERELCGRDSILSANIGIVHAELNNFKTDWPTLVGGFFSYLHRIVPPATEPHCAAEPSSSAGAAKCGDDVEFSVAPMIQVCTNYVLPVLFGFIGSLIYVLRSHYIKLQDATLSPKDLSLMPLRLVLGLVVAACVSLLVSSFAGSAGEAPIAPTGIPAGSLVASLTLSASGLAFLAGFGSEGVFLALQTVVTKVFAAPK